jgi:hypothetical protein
VTTIGIMAGATPRERIEQVGGLAVVGLVAAAQLSIAIAQILLAVAALCWLSLHLMRRERLEAPSFFWPLAGYAMLTLLAAGFSRDPVTSVADCKQLVLFLLIPLVYDFARGPRARLLLTVVITIGAVSALIGVVQFAIFNYDILGRRPQGTLSHWMTYSGTLMLVVCATVARLLYDTRDRGWAAVVMPALIVSLLLTSTRSAWVGCAISGWWRSCPSRRRLRLPCRRRRSSIACIRSSTSTIRPAAIASRCCRRASTSSRITR